VTTARTLDQVVLALSLVCGVSSLVLFGFFLWGPFGVVRWEWPDRLALPWDAALSLAFFVQHSGMVRRGFRARLAAWVPACYHGAVYTIASAVVLTIVVVLWQASATDLLVVSGVSRWVARACFVMAMAVLISSARALRSFDVFGLAPIRAHRSAKPERPATLVVRGPYRWVRHPFYACILVFVWSCPDLTADRLVFNGLWTAWIVLGALLEERDLMAEFGDAYRTYRRQVPMLVPWRGPLAL
jgi:protein-S-isoprenylcysteine O-methyltransferase Ste14